LSLKPLVSTLFRQETNDGVKEGDCKNQPIRLPGLKPGVCLSTNSRPRVKPRGSGLILSGAFYSDLKIGVCLRPELRPRVRRQTYQWINKKEGGIKRWVFSLSKKWLPFRW
jgi:hypothetical protein